MDFKCVFMAVSKEAQARIKINKYLEEAGACIFFIERPRRVKG